MRRSPLLHTAHANFLFALIGVSLFGWVSFAAAKTVSGYSVGDLLSLATAGNWPLLFGAGLVMGVVAFVAPIIVRLILAKRILVLVAVIALVVVDPLLAVATVTAVLLSMGLIRAAHGGIGATVSEAFDFSEISFPWKVLFTIGGALIVVGISTMPRLPLDISSFLPWPVFSVYGLIAVVASCLSLGFVVGNFYFPKIIHSTWAMLAFFCVMLAINPVVGAIATGYGLLLMFVESRQADEIYYVDDEADEIDPFHPFTKNNEAAKMIERSLTPYTPESEARGFYRNDL